MKKWIYLLFAALSLCVLTACEDNTDSPESAEFTENWQLRNALFFAERMTEAKTAIAQAQALHGEAWAEHCEWRVFRSYAKMQGGIMADSICVKILERGKGSGCPLYTDSVKINYLGRLMPTESYADGKIFDHSGLYESEDYVFNPNFATPVNMAVNGVIEGFSTALMHMHIGDRWRVYIPQELAYKDTDSKGIPAYTTLVFDLQLKGYKRAGVK